MLETIIALSLWGWVFVFGAIILMVILVEHEADWVVVLGLLLLGGWACVTYGFGTSLSWLYANAGPIALWAAGWVAVGLAWSVFKWDRLVAAAAKRYAKDEDETDIPKWTDHKAKLTSWTIWWPFSALAYVVGDLLREAIDWCLSLMGKLYDAITNRHFKNLPDPKTKLEARRLAKEEHERRGHEKLEQWRKS